MYDTRNVVGYIYSIKVTTSHLKHCLCSPPRHLYHCVQCEIQRASLSAHSTRVAGAGFRRAGTVTSWWLPLVRGGTGSSGSMSPGRPVPPPSVRGALGSAGG